jgi:hypothetical protein
LLAIIHRWIRSDLKKRPIMLFRHRFNCKFAPLLLSLATALCLLTAFTPAQAQSNLRLGNMQVITAPHTPPVFEIGLPRSLPAGSSIKLASPYAHAQAGFTYPLWLSDADITVKQRRGQPQALMIQAKRSPAQSDHELLLELSQSSGASQLIPYVFLTDPIAPSSADLPMPELPESGEPAPEARPTLAEVIERLGNQPRQPNQGATTANTLPPLITDATVSAARPRQMPQKIKKPAARKAVRVQPPKTETVAPTAAATATAAAAAVPPAAAPPETPASGPVVAASAPAALVSAPTDATNPTWLSRQLANPLNLALAAALLLLLAYVIVRLWQAKRAAKAKNVPVLTRETGLQPTSHGAANTVFGLSDQEAVAMQQQWVQQQMGKKT